MDHHEHEDAILLQPRDARALLVLAHGAGAGMHHPFMAAVAEALARKRVATWRWEFPYMRRGGWPPDRPPVALPAVRDAVARARMVAPGLPLFAGGKSFGGRMTSMAAAEAPLPVQGLVFLGFPLHTAKRPGTARGEHLARVEHPMLFLQGDRDRLAKLALLKPVVEELGPRGTLHVVEGADHAFQVLKRSGRTPAEVLEETAAVTAAWMGEGLDRTSGASSS